MIRITLTWVALPGQVDGEKLTKLLYKKFNFECITINSDMKIKVVGKQGCVMVPRKRINYGLLRSIIRDVASIVEMEDRQVLDVFFA
jgi:hypothetical protein